MKRALVPGVLVLLLALSACSGGETTGEQSAPTPAGTTTQESAQSAEADEPLTAETPAASEDASTPEGAFLVKIREVLPDNTSIPNATDAQLLAAAQEACAQMADGADSTLVSVIDGEQKDGAGYFQDSARIGSVAKQTICP